MVRAIVGTMIEVGTEVIDQQAFKEIVQGLDRRKAGEAVPAHGLYLNKITYPEHIYQIED